MNIMSDIKRQGISDTIGRKPDISISSKHLSKAVSNSSNVLSYVNDAINALNASLELQYLQLSDPNANMTLLREQIDELEVKRRKEILKLHIGYSKIWTPEGSQEIYKTYLPDPENKRGRRIIESRTRKGLEDKIVAWYLERKDKPLSFGDCYEKWFEEEKKPRISNATIARYQQDIRRFFSTGKGQSFFDTPVREISETDIDTFIFDVLHRDKLCREAVKGLYRILRSTFEFAWRRHFIEENPIARLPLDLYTRSSYPSKKANLPQTIPSEHWSLIMEQLRVDEKKDLMTAFALEAASLTGMRPGELAGLLWSDIERDCIRICHSRKYDPVEHLLFQAGTKTHLARIFPMTEDLYDLFCRVRKVELENGWLSDHVFCDAKGALTSGKITSCLHNKCRQLGLQHEYSATNIRKTVNSVAKAQGSSTMEAASLLGHTSATNERYYTKDVTTDREKLITADRMNLTKWAQKNRGQHRSTHFLPFDSAV